MSTEVSEKRTDYYNMMTVNELWSVREGEVLHFHEEEPSPPYCSYFAVQIRPIAMPPGPVEPLKNGKPNEYPEQCAIIAARRNSIGEWQWLYLSPGTKEEVGNFLLDKCNVDRDRWYFLSVSIDESYCADQRNKMLNEDPATLGLEE